MDIALFDALMSALTLPAGILFATGRPPSRMGNDHPSVAPYETLDASDGRIVVAAGNPRLWKQLCQAIGRPELETDSRFSTNSARLAHRAALKHEIERVFSQHTVDQLVERLHAHGVPCGRVRSIEQALASDQLRERDMLIEMTRPDLGAIRNIGNPIKLSRTPYSINRPPPKLGEHTDEVLRDLFAFKE